MLYPAQILSHNIVVVADVLYKLYTYNSDDDDDDDDDDSTVIVVTAIQLFIPFPNV